MRQSKLAPKYSAIIDNESAYEILNAKLNEAAAKTAAITAQTKEEPSILEKVLDSSVVKQAGRTAASIITRSLLGALGLGGKSKKSWF